MTGRPAARRAELAAALSEVRARIDAACRTADRRPDEVRLVAVTKTFPVADAALLCDLDMLDLAENREQEAVAKAADLRELRPEAAVRWHMVGRLQRNKARSVVRWAAEVQSVDSPRLAEALARASGNAVEAGERDGPLDVLVQASIDGDQARGGCPIEELPSLADVVARWSELRLRGIMAVAPRTMAPVAAFARLAEAAARLRDDHPEATELSAGMTNDLEAAITHGSTCVRVGTALLGTRGLASL